MRQHSGQVVCAVLLTAGGLSWLAPGCTPECGIITGSIATTVGGGGSPAQEIEQVYYLGVFDPQDQVPPTVYRITVRGQASVLSGVKFASGWAPAHMVDSLNTHIALDATKAGGENVKITGADGESVHLKTGRRLVLFGPEGFREAPKDHRLVIVMGQSPEAFFNAMDTMLGEVSQAQAEMNNSALKTQLLETLIELKDRDKQLGDMGRGVGETVDARKADAAAGAKTSSAAAASPAGTGSSAGASTGAGNSSAGPAGEGPAPAPGSTSAASPNPAGAASALPAQS